MRKLLLTSLLILTGINLAHASDGYENIAGAAHRLDNAANHFYEQLRYDAGNGHMTQDARMFAKAANHFHRQVEHGGSYGHIRGDYVELASAYAHVREELGARHGLSRDRHLLGDFREVESAFDNLNHAIEYSERRYSQYRYNDRHGHRYEGDRQAGRGSGRYDSGFAITFRGIFGS